MDVRWQDRVAPQYLATRQVAIMVAIFGVKMRAEYEMLE
jgi:hypothetical protein